MVAALAGLIYVAGTVVACLLAITGAEKLFEWMAVRGTERGKGGRLTEAYVRDQIAEIEQRWTA